MDPQSIDEILPNTLGMDEHVVEFCILHNYKIGGLTGASRVLYCMYDAKKCSSMSNEYNRCGHKMEKLAAGQCNKYHLKKSPETDLASAQQSGLESKQQVHHG